MGCVRSLVGTLVWHPMLRVPCSDFRVIRLACRHPDRIGGPHGALLVRCAVYVPTVSPVGPCAVVMGRLKTQSRSYEYPLVRPSLDPEGVDGNIHTNWLAQNPTQPNEERRNVSRVQSTDFDDSVACE